MRLGAPHKIDRCANRCSLYPPPAAVAYVARQREPVTDRGKGCPYAVHYNFISYISPAKTKDALNECVKICYVFNYSSLSFFFLVRRSTAPAARATAVTAGIA